MGNTVGKKKKMSSATSAKWVAQDVQQPKKDAMSPLGRSYSMPVQNSKPKVDNYHYVALTSSTYGALKENYPNLTDDRRGASKSQHLQPQQQGSRLKGEPRPGDSLSFNFEEKLRELDMPKIMVSKQWSDMDEILAKYHYHQQQEQMQQQQQQHMQHSGDFDEVHAAIARGDSLEALRAVSEDEPETINMWELMEGLHDESQSPFSSHPATPSPIAARAPPAVGIKKLRNVGASLSFSAVHNAKEVDAGFLDEAVAGSRSRFHHQEAAADQDAPGTQFKGFTRSQASGPAFGTAGRLSNNPAPSSGTVTSSRPGLPFGKENDSSNPVPPRDANLSTLTPVKLNTTGLQQQQQQQQYPYKESSGDYMGSNNNGIRSVKASTGLGPFANAAPSSKASGGGIQAADSSLKVHGVPPSFLRVSSDSRMMKKPLPTSTPPLNSSSKFAPSPPRAASSPRFGPDVSRRGGLLPSRPDLTNPTTNKASKTKSLPKSNAENAAYTSPFGPSTSSSEDSEQQFRNGRDEDEEDEEGESPQFFPDLIANLEKDIEDKSENEWHHVRGSDAAGASTSGSYSSSSSHSSDSDHSPVGTSIVAKRISIMNSMSGNQSQKNSGQLGGISTAPVRKQRFEPVAGGGEGTLEPNLKRTPSKVVAEDFRDIVLQRVRRQDAFDKFEERCPPGGESRVVIYVTSLRGIRKTFEDCSQMKLVVLGYRVGIDERDISMHAEFKQELRDLLGKPMSVPRIFIKGRYIGGAEELTNLHEDGTLAKLLETMPKQTSWEKCDGCGDHRFVPCTECSGSCKVVNEDDQVVRCTECNENGLVRCPICF